jgi:type I restriction enzyme R subunit
LLICRHVRGDDRVAFGVRVTASIGDKIRHVIAEEIPSRVAQDKAYQNARPIKRQVEHDKAHKRVMLDLLQDHTELFKQFSDNPGFNRWLTDTVFNATYKPSEPGSPSPQAGQ